jgi:starvation-inducible DNA-binding protein
MPLNIGLSDAQRQGVIQLLTPLLADEYVLYTKTHNYHWNVVGPQFNDLHDFFQAQYTALNEVADDVAERIRALGVPAIGTLAEFIEHTRLQEHPGHYPDARDLLADHESVIQRLRVDPGSGAFLGNYPQAFSHIGVISSGVNLARASQEVRA